MDYSLLISEEVDFLHIQERLASQGQVRDRIRFLRLLKSGQAKTQSGAGLLMGLASRQSQRLWQTYRQQGFSALLTIKIALANYQLVKSASCSRFCAATRPET